MKGSEKACFAQFNFVWHWQGNSSKKTTEQNCEHHLHQTPFTPDTFDTRHIFTRNLLHQTTFTPTSFYTRHLLHQTPFTPDALYTRHLFTRHLLHQPAFTPDTFYTNQLLHQTPFTPDTFYTKPLYTRHLFTRHLSHQTPRHLLHQPTFTPNNLATLLFTGLPLLDPSHAISAAPARPQLVHRPSTGSSPSMSLLRP